MRKEFKMRMTLVECDLCDRAKEIVVDQDAGFFICRECWEELKRSIGITKLSETPNILPGK